MGSRTGNGPLPSLHVALSCRSQNTWAGSASLD